MVYLTSDTAPSSIPLTAFVDTQSNWAKNYIDALAAQKIISGFEDGTFRPDDPVTRVQFAAIVSKAFASLPAQRESLTFKDIRPSFWGAEAIQTAFQKGFMSGYPDTTFKPNQQIPRMEALVSLASGLKLSSATTDSLSFYQDAAQIPTWASGAIAAATDRQLVVNYPRVKTLNPTRPATRAEVAAFVYQALVDAGQLSAIPSPYVVLVGSQSPSPNPSSTPSPSPSPLPSPTPTPTPLPSPTPDPIPLPSPTPTPSPLPSPSPSPTPTPSPSPGNGSFTVPTVPVNP
ncbi:MAG: S-layer homology domain-containing protein [Lyngbya sp. HA4199-MV5]|nr:S-layer homology domain-containing protein [Lyngbya sp. HA4199-MV5]